jgi:uncharacterized protein
VAESWKPASGAAKLALQVGMPELWSVDEFDAEDLSVTVALVGAPAAPHPLAQPRHLMRSLDLLQRELPQGQRLVTMHSNENGVETTMNGWIQPRVSLIVLVVALAT